MVFLLCATECPPLILWCRFSLTEDLFLNLLDKLFSDFSGIFPKSVNFLDSLSELGGSS